MTAAPSTPYKNPLESSASCLSWTVSPDSDPKALSGEVRWEEQGREKPAVQSGEEEDVPGKARWERTSSGERTPVQGSGSGLGCGG